MTWSIVAVDSATGEVGVAVASCVPLDVVLRVPGILPSRGAIATQSHLLDGERERGLELLDSGLSPDDVLGRLIDPAFDPDFALRQIAVIDREGRIATFTGAQTLPYAAHATRHAGSLAVSVQGNLLTGPEVIAAATNAAMNPASCDLPARLLAALEAGGADGRGDGRCTPLGRSAQAATLHAGAFAIDVGVDEAGAGEDPLAILRSHFLEARGDHPCPAAKPTTSSSGGADVGSAEPPRVAAEAADGNGCSLGARDASLSLLLALAIVAKALVGVSCRRFCRPSWSARRRSRR